VFSAREGEVIVTTLHFSDVVHVDGRMLGALDEYVGALGVHRYFGGSAAFTKAFLWDCSLALAALTRLLFGLTPPWKHELPWQTSVHAFIEVLHLPPFYTSAFPSSPRVHVSSPGAR